MACIAGIILILGICSKALDSLKTDTEITEELAAAGNRTYYQQQMMELNLYAQAAVAKENVKGRLIND